LNLACRFQVAGCEHLFEAWKEENRVGRGILTGMSVYLYLGND